MEKTFKNATHEVANKATNAYGFNFAMDDAPVVAQYDNEGACAELAKDMARKDNLSIKFTKDSEGYASLWIETKNVAGYKVRLNPTIFAWVMQYLKTGNANSQYEPMPMSPIETDSDAYRVDILKLFINAGKKIQWTPLFRERNGKLSGSYIAKYGKVFFYVDYTEDLINWLRERKQAI